MYVFLDFSRTQCGLVERAVLLLTWSLHNQERGYRALGVNSLLYLGAIIPAAKCTPRQRHMEKWLQQPASPSLHVRRLLQTQAQPACIFTFFLSQALIAGFNFSGLKLHFCLLSGKNFFREGTPVAWTVSEPDSYISARSPVKPLEMYQINLCRAIILSSGLASYPLSSQISGLLLRKQGN